jgi:hypothetical protein
MGQPSIGQAQAAERVNFARNKAAERNDSFAGSKNLAARVLFSRHSYGPWLHRPLASAPGRRPTAESPHPSAYGGRPGSFLDRRASLGTTDGEPVFR